MNFAMDVVAVTYIRKTRNLHKKAKESLEVQKIVVPLHPQSGNNLLQSVLGSLDEWLSQRSAKPCTAVRIRQEPQRKEVWVSG